MSHFLPLSFSTQRASFRPLLSTRPTSSAKPVFDPAPFRPKKKHRFLGLRIVLLLGLLGLVSLAEPRVFRFAVRHLVVFEAWRAGGRASVARVEGSLFEPVVLVDSAWSFGSEAVTRFEVKRVTADFAWEHFFQGSAAHWFRRLSLDGVSGKIELPRGARKPGKARRFSPPDLGRLRARWMPAPAVVEAREVDLLIVSGADFVRLQQAHFRVSEREPGIVKAGRVVVQQKWLRRTFPNVRGTTALKDSELLIARLVLEPGVEIKSFSTDLAKLAHGELDQKADIDAFGGNMHVDAGMKTDTAPPHFGTSGQFKQIDIGRLASFLSLSEAAGGTIKEGNFSFQGSPHDVGRSTTRLHLDATNFQWESRQWDSLILGLTLIDRRLQVHDCALHQGHNALTLDGEVTLPEPGTQWWQGDFQGNVSAKIENLTELSALLLPEFKYAAGRGSIEGTVRGHAEKFQGHLVVEGSRLRWRDAPIEELNAALRINGNELQVAHLNIFNDDDYVRGNGVVNILGPTQYWGTLRASVADLADYAALLQRPVVPEPLAGGALIDWDGEGSAKGHSGKFAAHLRKLRSVGARGAQLHPINADLEGSYAAGGMVFSKFALADDESSFTANVAVGNMALALQGIRLMHRQQLWLEGDAVLPLDVWRKWPNTSLDSLLTEGVPGKVALTAYNLELGAAAKLSGWNFPIAGVVNGSVSAEGALGALKTGGKLTLAKARLPLGSSGEALSEVEGEVTFDAQTMTVARLVGKHPTGDFRAVGSVDLKNVRDPGLLFAVESDRSEVPLFQSEPAMTFPAKVTASLKLQVEGPLSAATVRGNATPVDAQIGGELVSLGTRILLGRGDEKALAVGSALALNVSNLWSRGGAELPPVFPALSAPWSAWSFDITAQGGPLALPSALSTFDLRLAGKGAAPELTGSVAFQDVTFAAGDVLMRHGSGSMTWRGGEVFIDARATGELHECEFTAHVLGPNGKPLRFFEFSPPLTEALLNDALAGRYRAIPPLETATRFSFHAPSALIGEVEVFDWRIVDPPAE